MVIPILSWAQSNEPNDLVTSAFNASEISSLNDDQIELLNFQATSGYVISPGKAGLANCIASEELLNKTSNEAISLSDLENFNIHLYDFEQSPTSHTNYCFEDGTVILIYSTQRLETLLTRHQINTQNN
ncbi:MAG: hypothetical protein ACJAV7_002588 [Flavobacteriales bacterium]|jgi:hypothetical protein